MKIRNLITSIALASVLGAGVFAGISLNGKKIVREVQAAGNTPVTKITLNDNAGWCFRTLWCEEFSFSDGYSINELRYFISDFYVTSQSTFNKEGTTKAYHEYNGNFNLCAGGGAFYLPTWVTNCKITIENNSNSYYMNWLNSIYKYSNNPGGGTNDGGVGKQITLNAENWGGSSSVGSAATESSWNTTVSFIVKDDLGNDISSSSLSTSKYDKLDTSIPFGYTAYGFYTNAAMTTQYNKTLPLAQTTIYKKLTVNRVAYASGTFNSWNASDINYIMLPNGDQQFYIRITLAANAEFKFVVWSEWHGWSQVDQSSTVVTNGSVVQGTNPDSTGYRIKAAVAGTYEVYFKNNYDNNKIWIQQDAATEATAYATEFLNTITCTSTSTTFNINSWNTVGAATTSMEYKFGQLTAGASGLLKIANADEGGTIIEQCAARYDRILSKYGYGTASGQYHDFMERTPAKSGSGRAIILNQLGSNTYSITIAVAVSLISVSTIGGYIFLKRRKDAE